MPMKNNKVSPRRGRKSVLKRVRKSLFSFGGKSSSKNKDQVLAQANSVDTAESFDDPLDDYLLPADLSLDTEETLRPSLINDPRQQTPDQADTSISSQEDDNAVVVSPAFDAAREVEYQTNTNSVVVQLFAEPKTAPLSNSKPTLFLSAALLFMTLFVTILGAYLEGNLDHVQLPSFEKATAAANRYLQVTIETVGPQPTVHSLFSLSEEEVSVHFQRFNLEEVEDLLW
jgi:hypothetical protein